MSYRAEVKAGEAAKYGIFYDDRHYDYTQHLKPIGKAPGAVFVAATASTIEHDSTGKEVEADPMAAETAINKATYETIRETDADPAVLEVLEALDDEAYIDEGDFEDDFIVKLDREEARVLAPVTTKKGKGSRNLDKDFETMLQMYDGEFDLDDLSFDEEYEAEHGSSYYSEDDDASVDVVGLEEAKPFSQGGPSRMYQVDEVRRELRDGHAALLDRILYTTDDDSDNRPEEIIEIDALNLDTKIMNCQNACQFLTSGSHKLNRPKLIREESANTAVKPIRISRKTGMPIQEDDIDQQPQERKATLEEEPVNKGVARNKEESPEEKRARKAAIKDERRLRRVQKKTYVA
jgi:protein LTV1